MSATAIVGVPGIVYGLYQLFTRLRTALDTWNTRMQQVQRERLRHSLRRFQQACDKSSNEAQSEKIKQEVEQVDGEIDM